MPLPEVPVTELDWWLCALGLAVVLFIVGAVLSVRAVLDLIRGR